MRILLLSAYDAASHRYWREGLVTHLAEHEWSVLTLPARFFSWRVRGNALSWLAEQRETLTQPYDLIIATSMVDLATLKGLLPTLAATPALLYFHENQFAYPQSAHTHAGVEAQITSMYSALAADCLLFNSEYNRSTFLHGASALLKKLPDHAPLTIIESLARKSSVLPVPLADDCFHSRPMRTDGPLTLLWNHRREYDKGPDRLHLVLRALKMHGLDFRIHIIGQQFRHQPEIFTLIHDEFRLQIGAWGFIEGRQKYLQILQQSDIVLSTALHDFQGLAMLEGMAAGCQPVAPDRLAYPEYIPAQFLCHAHNDNAEKDAASIAGRIITLASEIRQGLPLPIPELLCHSWSHLIGDYRAALMNTVSTT